MSKFRFSIEAHFTLGADEVWPEGDAPADPTTEQALAVVNRYIDQHGMDGFLEDWNLLDDLQVSVNGAVARTHGASA
jgi:hypothetical protein